MTGPPSSGPPAESGAAATSNSDKMARTKKSFVFMDHTPREKRVNRQIETTHNRTAPLSAEASTSQPKGGMNPGRTRAKIEPSSPMARAIESNVKRKFTAAAIQTAGEARNRIT